jgi:6,7-dimethyl-8-ribityllumazine synthase
VQIPKNAESSSTSSSGLKHTPLVARSGDASTLKIGVVTARFNAFVTDKLESGALDTLKKLGCPERGILAVRVPGAFEIPLAAKALLEAGCDAVVALGAVIRGETSHYDFVCTAVERGCTEVQLRVGKPVAFGVLTTDNEQQAEDRAGGKYGNKGSEAAEVAVEMANLLLAIRGR